MATYKEIREWVKSNHGFTPESCWIAHCKEMCCLHLKKAHNRKGEVRAKPCPDKRKDAIIEAFHHFGML